MGFTADNFQEGPAVDDPKGATCMAAGFSLNHQVNILHVWLLDQIKPSSHQLHDVCVMAAGSS